MNRWMSIAIRWNIFLCTVCAYFAIVKAMPSDSRVGISIVALICLFEIGLGLWARHDDAMAQKQKGPFSGPR